MSNRVTSTSRAAFHNIAHVDTQEARIVRLVLYYTQQGHDLTLGEIARILRMEKSTVSARLNGLRNNRDGSRRVFLLDGAEYEVFQNGTRKCSLSGVRCAAWQILPAVAPVQLQLNLN